MNTNEARKRHARDLRVFSVPTPSTCRPTARRRIFLCRDKKLFRALYEDRDSGELRVKIEGDDYTGHLDQKPGQ